MRERPYLAFFIAPALAYLAVLLLVAVFVVEPTTLGWVGFGVAATIGLLVAAGASVLLPRSRTNADQAHPHPDGLFRLLVVADTRCEIAQLCRAVRNSTAGRAADVLVLAPVITSPLHFLTDSEDREREEACARLAEIVQELTRLGVAARGRLGDDDPLPAIGDALVEFPAREILLVMPEDRRRSWLEHDLERRARDAYGVHVSELTVGVAPSAMRVVF